ncbi:hypothetical protein HMPREF0322_02041 [Desulfitobacterium hafniense DP7]|uniref:Uncharacterized protein n=1 Tax=Desulfitobacterium hafniense DP7 TaxID=537010 RepID=G9XM55_DESHA|nr:hypothetical protein HMPREF0322_02041 [Desulfitobacterium hafniense DP7]
MKSPGSTEWWWAAPWAKKNPKSSTLKILDYSRTRVVLDREHKYP